MEVTSAQEIIIVNHGIQDFFLILFLGFCTNLHIHNFVAVKLFCIVIEQDKEMKKKI